MEIDGFDSDFSFIDEVFVDRSYRGGESSEGEDFE
jgi:hypothetical protein